MQPFIGFDAPTQPFAVTQQVRFRRARRFGRSTIVIAVVAAGIAAALTLNPFAQFFAFAEAKPIEAWFNTATVRHVERPSLSPRETAEAPDLGVLKACSERIEKDGERGTVVDSF